MIMGGDFSSPFFLGGVMYVQSYSEFVSHILGLLDYLGVLSPIKFGLMFILALMGITAFVRFMSGGRG
jgi:hypothetical protein